MGERGLDPGDERVPALHRTLGGGEVAHRFQRYRPGQRQAGGRSTHKARQDRLGRRRLHGMRLIVARCEVSYTGRLTTVLPEALRLLMIKADGSVLVTAPAFTGGSGPLSARAGAAATQMKDGPVSHASGRFTIVTDGEILTNNSEDGPRPHAAGREVHWDVNPSSTKVPEALVKL